MSLYLDSSALVKLVAEEPESASLHSFVGQSRLVSSQIARVELPRAARRYGTEGSAAMLLMKLDFVALQPDLLESAAGLEPATLSSLDAIHLASALTQRDGIDAFVAYDARLLAAAEAAGLAVSSPA